MKVQQIFLFLFTVFSIAAVAGTDQNLPDIGDPSGSVVSPEFERRLGQAIMRNVREYANVIKDPEVESYVQSIGYKLVANSDDNQLPFTFFMMRNKDINAFAAPGGVVGINSGVILNSESESELASVIAHEISHVTQHHMARSYEAASKYSLPMAAAALGALLLGIANPQAGQAALAIITGAGAQQQINFTRANEEEADRIGMQLLARAGFDPYGMPRFFEKLQEISRLYRGNPPEFLLTHPLTTSRIAESISRAERYPRKDYESSNSYKLIRAKTRAEAFDNTSEAVSFFEIQIKQGGYPDMPAARYGYAIALTNNGDFSAAEKQLTQLLANDRENVNYLLAAARLESARKNYDSALTIYRQTEKLYPDYRPLVYAYARALLDAKQPAKAREVLRNYSLTHEQDIIYYDLLSQAEAQTGAAVESAIAKAEYYYLVGGTQLAIDHLLFAQRQNNLDYHQKERIQARLEQLQYELELEKELDLVE
ncbi:MAG TPA: M48 family metalloprotease [Gammaproteobacteria bacterium]|nr:M48 family metalloprotease [Gammaproteobacteria bacterium]